MLKDFTEDELIKLAKELHAKGPAGQGQFSQGCFKGRLTELSSLAMHFFGVESRACQVITKLELS